MPFIRTNIRNQCPLKQCTTRTPGRAILVYSTSYISIQRTHEVHVSRRTPSDFSEFTECRRQPCPLQIERASIINSCYRWMNPYGNVFICYVVVYCVTKSKVLTIFTQQLKDSSPPCKANCSHPLWCSRRIGRLAKPLSPEANTMILSKLCGKRNGDFQLASPS